MGNNKRKAIRMAHSPLIHETIEYKRSVPVTTRTFDHCINSRDMKYIGEYTVSSESVETKVYVYNENISDWEIDRGQFRKITNSHNSKSKHILFLNIDKTSKISL